MINYNNLSTLIIRENINYRAHEDSIKKERIIMNYPKSNEVELVCYVIEDPIVNLLCENIYGAEFKVRQQDGNPLRDNNEYSCLAIGNYAKFIDKWVGKNDKIIIKGFYNIKRYIDESEVFHETHHLYITYISLCTEENEYYLISEEEYTIFD